MANGKGSEIRICNVAHDLHNDLQNIAKNSGITLQQFLKPKLRDIANSYPEAMKKPPTKD
jgi:hypothetical protein